MLLMTVAALLALGTPLAQGGTCITDTLPAHGRQATKAFKGVELYSWKASGEEFSYALLWGTNRSKTDAEIKSPQCALPDVSAVKVVLGKLSRGESVFWSNEMCPGKDCVYPSPNVIQTLGAHAKAVGVDLVLEKDHPPE